MGMGGATNETGTLNRYLLEQSGKVIQYQAGRLPP